jgi:hypothetical protein
MRFRIILSPLAGRLLATTGAFMLFESSKERVSWMPVKIVAQGILSSGKNNNKETRYYLV